MTKVEALLVVLLALSIVPIVVLGKPKNNENKSIIPSTNFLETFDKILSDIERILYLAVNRVMKFIINVVRAIYIILAVVGVILWITHWNPSRGKHYILAAIILMLLAEYLSTIIGE